MSSHTLPPAQFSSSTTALTVGTGAQSLTIGTGLTLAGSTPIVISYGSGIWMQGTVTSYNSGSGALVVNVTVTSGSGSSLTPWVISTNIPTWPDTITADVTNVRKVHIDDAGGSSHGLRDYARGEVTRRGLTTAIFADQPLVANVTDIRAQHILDLRTALDNIRSGVGNGGDGTYPCQVDSFGATNNWTDTLITNITSPRAVHITEMRTKVQSLMTACVCETEQCQYCADCGYYYGVFHCPCNVNTCGCNNSQGPQSCSYYYTNYYFNCASVNVGGTNPYKNATGSATEPISALTTATWDGTVPWAWGSGIPGGSADWTAYWSCKCNPFTHA